MTRLAGALRDVFLVLAALNAVMFVMDLEFGVCWPFLVLSAGATGFSLWAAWIWHLRRTTHDD